MTSIIVILISYQPLVTDPFGKENNNDTYDKTEDDIENGNLLPPEMRMFIGEDETKNGGYGNADIQGQA